MKHPVDTFLVSIIIKSVSVAFLQHQVVTLKMQFHTLLAPMVGKQGHSFQGLEPL